MKGLALPDAVDPLANLCVERANYARFAWEGEVKSVQLGKARHLSLPHAQNFSHFENKSNQQMPSLTR